MINHNGNWHRPFLNALARLGVVAEACRAVSVSRSAVAAARKSDADFEAAFDDAMQEALDLAEQELWQRAVHGYHHPLTHQGRIVYEDLRDEDGNVIRDEDGNPLRGEVSTIVKKSDDLLKFLLAGRRKEVFATRTELTGANGKDINAMDETARAQRVAQLLEVAKARAEAAQREVDDLEDLV